MRKINSLKEKNIKGFIVVTGRPSFCDMVLVTNLGVEFYKFSEKPLKVVMLKSYSVNISDFWYEAGEGILIVNVLNTAEFVPFMLYQNKGIKYFQGLSFKTEQKFMDFGFSYSLTNYNLINCALVPLDKVQIMVAKIYESVFLLSLDGLFGLLTLIKIEPDGQSSKFLSIYVKPGGYTLRVSDNLIVLHNYGPQESYVYDIKREKDSNFHMVLVKHRGSLNEDSEMFQVKHPSEIDPHLIAVADDFYIDLNETKIFSLSIDPELLLKGYPDHIEKILFTLRKNKSLKPALEMLKECLDAKLSPIRLNDLFNITNFAYKETAMLRKAGKIDEKSDKRQSITSRFAENQLKSQGGMTILLQYEVLNCVFKPYYKDQKDFYYLSQVLITYISSLLRQDLHVHPSHQFLLTKTLIRINNFKALQNIFQYLMLGNEIHLAMLICKIENGVEKYPQIFNLGIDMLLRLKKYKEIAYLLAKKGDIYEALGVVATYQDEYDLEQLITIINDHSDEEVKGVAIEMMMAFKQSDKKSVSQMV